MEPLLKIDAVMERLKLKRHQVHKMVAENRIPHCRLSPRLIRFRQEDIRALEKRAHLKVIK